MSCSSEENDIPESRREAILRRRKAIVELNTSSYDEENYASVAVRRYDEENYASVAVRRLAQEKLFAEAKMLVKENAMAEAEKYQGDYFSDNSDQIPEAVLKTLVHGRQSQKDRLQEKKVRLAKLLVEKNNQVTLVEIVAAVEESLSDEDTQVRPRRRHHRHKRVLYSSGTSEEENVPAMEKLLQKYFAELKLQVDELVMSNKELAESNKESKELVDQVAAYVGMKRKQEGEMRQDFVSQPDLAIEVQEDMGCSAATMTKAKGKGPARSKFTRNEQSENILEEWLSDKYFGLTLDPKTPAKPTSEKSVIQQANVSLPLSSKNKRGKIINEDELSLFKNVTTAHLKHNMKIKVLMAWYGSLYGPESPQNLTFVAVDTEGSFFEVLVPHIVSKKWASRIQEGSVYYLRNLLPVENFAFPKMVDTRFQMTITKDIFCKQLEEHEVPSVDTLTLSTLSQIVNMPKKNEILRNFVLYVIDVGPLSIRNSDDDHPWEYVEVYVIDESTPTKATVLIVWKSIYENNIEVFGQGFTEPFVLTAIGLKLSTYKGKQGILDCHVEHESLDRYVLHATNFSRFARGSHMNKPTQEFQKWIDRNINLKVLAPCDLLEPDCLILTNIPLTKPMTIEEMIRSVPAHLKTKKEMSFVVHAMILCIHFDIPITDWTCSGCTSPIGGKEDHTKQCTDCGAEPIIPTPRFRIDANITDSSGQVRVSLLGRDAQEMLNMSLSQALKMRSEVGGFQQFITHCTQVNGSAYTFGLKVNARNVYDLQHSEYIVQSVSWIPRRCIAGAGKNKSSDEIVDQGNNWNVLSTNSASSENYSDSSEDSFVALPS